ncbi:PstS family phosphate ABC transporter substrate-binding protein [Chroococcus sp. FPU101]|uniref:PstS family phosphate ABC transporter substrate-binding protein n=1 Tax=Chroococcus sp. FPU101 TaxID=1974212 RepID=UPI001A8F51DB|nr:PstS family phosphate ABC transporter substrate-binding protein [Chroococcus sp. FPU101]GFE70496.1 phosphate ABC transporter periplasmic phosphate-binding protein [Chroococcus sp. FPU101]
MVNNFQFKLNRWTLGGTIAAVAATALAVPSVYSQNRTTVKIDGSSTVYPVTEAVAEDFQAKNRNTQVTVGVSGTGGGFKKFCAGETDISNASRPIKDSERQKCAAAGVKFIELPVAFDALTVVANKQNTAVNSMTVAELKKLWEPAAQGKITKWNQVNSKFPNAPVKLYGPGADSGTFDYFTEAVVGESKKSRTDYTPSEDDNVLVQGVSRDKNALGYFGYAYYEANKDKLKAIAVDGGKGPVMPSKANVENGKYSPLSRPIFIYVNSKAAQRPEVKQFVEYYINNASKLVSEVKYVPLPAATYKDVMDNFRKNKTGSVFVGKDIVGVTVQDIVRMEAKD